jgi:nitroreductase
MNGPELGKPFCIACGQCVAGCPNEALDNDDAPRSGQILCREIPVINPETAMQFLRSRRSIRNFRDEPVTREKIRQVLDIARIAPTACNSQGVSYLVIDSKEILRKITRVTVEWADHELSSGSPMAASHYAAHTASLVDMYRSTETDVVLRDAPVLIIGIADKNSMPGGRDNTYLAFAYAQLFAQSLNLGTCWAGLFEYCASSECQALLELLDLPDNKVVTSGMMIGYPKYSYYQLVERNPLEITWK